MAVVITPSDRHAFKRCRRAWDFGSRLRQGREPDAEPAADCWAWGRCFLGMDVTGIIYNELRTDTDLEAAGVADTTFRRTEVRRGPVELERARYTLGTEARAMTAGDVASYPSPSWDVCS